MNKNLFKNYTNGLIKLELIEYYDLNDLALNSLETITNDSKLLESSGVLYINFLDGNTFEYFGVPKVTYIKLVNAESPARFARRHIYNEFLYRSASKLVAAE